MSRIVIATHAVFALCAASLLTSCQPAGNSLAELSEPERTLFEQASEKRQANQMDEALDLYSKAAELSKGSVEAHIAIAEILRAENQSVQAEPILQNALGLKPNDPRVHMELGFARISKGDFVAAIAAFDKAISLDEDLGSAYSGKAVAYDLQGKHAEAQKIYAEAIARGLSSPSMDSNYALSLIFTGQYDEAIRLLQPHADANTATPVMRQNMALAYGLKGDVGRAKEYGERDLDPRKAKQNLEFYKRYTALKSQITGQPVQIRTDNPAHTEDAVPVSPVLEQDVGFTAGDKGKEVVLKPEIEVLQVDDEEFNAIVE